MILGEIVKKEIEREEYIDISIERENKAIDFEGKLACCIKTVWKIVGLSGRKNMTCIHIRIVFCIKRKV